MLDTVHTMHASLQEQADIIEKSKLSAKVVSQETSAEIAKEKVDYLIFKFLLEGDKPTSLFHLGAYLDFYLFYITCFDY